MRDLKLVYFLADALGMDLLVRDGLIAGGMSVGLQIPDSEIAFPVSVVGSKITRNMVALDIKVSGNLYLLAAAADYSSVLRKDMGSIVPSLGIMKEAVYMAFYDREEVQHDIEETPLYETLDKVIPYVVSAYGKITEVGKWVSLKKEQLRCLTLA